MRIAVIDLGSNSIRMSIFERSANDIPKTVSAYRRAVGLSEGMTGDMCLKLQPQLRTIAALLEYKEAAKEYGAETVIAVATAAVRKAKNQSEFLQLVKDTCGIEIKVIDGQTEAALDMLAIEKMLGCRQGLVCDIGGGSTELVGVGPLSKSISLPYGSRGIWEQFFCDKESEENVKRAIEFVQGLLAKEQWFDDFADGDIIGIGGSLRAMAKLDLMDCENGAISRHEIPIERYRLLEKMVMEKPKKERAALPGIGRERAEIILGGLAIFDAIADKLSPRRILVADVGVREGVCIDFYENCGILV